MDEHDQLLAVDLLGSGAVGVWNTAGAGSRVVWHSSTTGAADRSVELDCDTGGLSVVALPSGRALIAQYWSGRSLVVGEGVDDGPVLGVGSSYLGRWQDDLVLVGWSDEAAACRRLAQLHSRSGDLVVLLTDDHLFAAHSVQHHGGDLLVSPSLDFEVLSIGRGGTVTTVGLLPERRYLWLALEAQGGWLLDSSPSASRAQPARLTPDGLDVGASRELELPEGGSVGPVTVVHDGSAVRVVAGRRVLDLPWLRDQARAPQHGPLQSQTTGTS